MHRLSRTDFKLDRLNEQREQLAIEISLLREAEVADPERLSTLENELAAVETSIKQHRPIAD